MSNSNFFTQAGNFTSTISGSVDPRTGLYNISINLGTITGNNLQGPSFPVTLSYSPLASQNNPTGTGNGISLGLSCYDRNTGRLSLSTGEQYQLNETDNDVTVLQKKLDSFTIVKNQGDNYKVMHKNGNLEYLAGAGFGANLKLTTRIINPAGHTMTVSTNNNNQLSEINDASGTLLTATYTLDRTTLIFYPDTSEEYTVYLDTNNGNLQTITRTAQNTPPLVWNIGYTQVGTWGVWANSLQSPSGMLESVNYRHDNNTNKFPQSAPPSLQNMPLPYVIQCVKTPGQGQPAMVSEYSYSPQNFLGFNSGVSWSAVSDNLYGCLSGYQYSSMETQAPGTDDETTITRIYNSYHLLTSTETTSKGCTTLKETEYYARPNTTFDNQPSQFQCPKKNTTTWTDGVTRLSRVEVTDLQFDESGNPTYKKDPDGTVTISDYYPPNGSGSDCPPEPNGFTRFIRAVTVTPPVTAYADCPVHRTEYTYSENTPAGTDVTSLVLKATETHYADSITLSDKAFTYSQDSATAGLLTKKVSTHHDSGKAFSRTTAIVRSTGDTPDSLTSGYTLKTHDGKILTTQKTVSRLTGKVQKVVDARGLITTYSHNSMGLPLSRTHAVGTAYERSVTFDYQIADSSTPFTVVVTNKEGSKVRHNMDGMGRLFLKEKNDIDNGGANTWYAMQEQSYDALGRSLVSTARDYVTGGQNQTQVQTRVYDGWGQVEKSVGNDAVTTMTQTNLVNDPAGSGVAVWQTRTWNTGGEDSTGVTTTTYDDHHNPVRTDLYLKDGTTLYSHTSMSYDGWGQLRKQTNENGQVTSYSYDVMGRPVTTTLPDNTIVSKDYVNFCKAKLPVSVSVNETLLGTQTFDGLCRLKSQRIGDRDYRNGYQSDSYRHPFLVSNPGTQEQHRYVRELNDAPSSVLADGGDGMLSVSQAWTYDAPTGDLLTATEKGTVLSYEYYASGLSRESRTNALASQVQQYSQGGAPVSYRDYAGAQTSVERDELGRPVKVTDDAIIVDMTYDGLGNLSTQNVTTAASGKSYSKLTDITLDDFGREVIRTITDTNGETIRITQVWSKDHKVTRRVSTLNNGTLRDERYVWDLARGWLLNYTVTGSERPKNENGDTLSGQTFSWDVLGNMLTRHDILATGKEMLTYHYDNADPCQMSALTFTGADKKSTTTILGYDDAGRMTKDEQGRTLAYDALGRLASVTLSDGTQACRYTYDASNRVFSQTVSGDTTNRYYQGDKLEFLTDNAGNDTRLLGQSAQVRRGENAGTWLNSADMNGSVLNVSDGEQSESGTYSPFGQQAITD